MSRLVFLVASERSGSNLLTRVLGAHSRISGPSPTHLFRLFANNGWRYGDLRNDTAWHDLIADILENYEAKLGAWDIHPERNRLIELERTVLAPILSIYESQAEFEGADVIFIKENQTAEFAPTLIEHFPTARFVHLVRDPRDVAASWIRTTAMPGGVERATTVWLRDQQAARALESASAGRLHSLRYEDLVEAAEPTVGRVLQFLGLPFEPVHLSFFHSTSVRRDSERIDAWRNLSRPLMTGNTKRYRNELTTDEILYVEERCSDLMGFYGYDRYQRDDGIKRQTTRPSVSGNTTDSSMTEAETSVRARRLAAIRRVLERQPPCSGADR